MSEPASRPGLLRFGELSLDLSSGELIRDGARVRLQEHVFRILELLTAHPGELVTRERLIEHVWPRPTYIDTDAGINTAVKKLRVVLGDDADAPRFVETVPRRGYRFIAPVSTEPVMTVGEAPSSVGRALPAWWRRAALGGFVALLAAVGGTLGARFLPGRSTSPVAQMAPAEKLPERNVAVLPFLNLTGDPQREHVALGLSEMLLHRLADVREINVIARTSSFAFQGRNEDVRDIGRKLNARYLVEGSLQDSSNRLRITTQLIDAATGAHVWSKTFDRGRSDIFAVQDEITLEVARALRLSLTAQTLRPIGTASFDAWLAYEQGRALLSARRTQDLRSAVASLERAVRLDPQFVAAHVELAHAYMNEASFASLTGPSSDEVALRAATHVDRALALDPANGEALIASARIAEFEGDVATAAADYRRGLALSPNHARGHQHFGQLLIDRLGKVDEGLAMVERARLLDPLEPRGPYYAGLVELFRDNSAAGERLMIETLQIRPDYSPALVRLGWSSWRYQGRFADAVKYGEQALLIDPDSVWARTLVAGWYLELGEVDAALSLLAPQAAQPRLAMRIHFYRGEYERAGELLYAQPDSFETCDTDAYVLIEHARVTAQAARAQTFLQERVSFRDRENRVTLERGQEDVAIAMARLLESSGKGLEARQLLEAVLVRLNDPAPAVPSPCVNTHAARARALAALGRHSEAVIELRHATLQQRAWSFGWYTFERDPLFAPLHEDPGFLALREAYRTRVSTERARLAQLRAHGLIPQRPLGKLARASP